MKNLKQVAYPVEKSWKRELLFPAILFLVVLIAAGMAGRYFDHTTNQQSIDLLRQSARKAMVQCYAIEGSYPSDIAYLEDNYGLEYNHEKYFIDYEVFGSNVMPNLEVYEKK